MLWVDVPFVPLQIVTVFSPLPRKREIRWRKTAWPASMPMALASRNAGAVDPHGPYPKLLWEFSHERMGESWSEPVITRVKVRGGLTLGDRCGKNDGDGDCREQSGNGNRSTHFR